MCSTPADSAAAIAARCCSTRRGPVTTELMRSIRSPAAEGLAQAGRVVEVPEPGLDPGRERVGRARHEHEVVRGHPCEQLRRDATAQIAGGARDDDRHETGSGQNPSLRWAICSPRRW